MGRRFADSHKALIAALSTCYPQFVRCIKPNHHKSPEIFAGFLTFRQLVNSVMIEAINARQAGYAVRIHHAEFLYEFACLVKSARCGTRARRLAVALPQACPRALRPPRTGWGRRTTPSCSPRSWRSWRAPTKATPWRTPS